MTGRLITRLQRERERSAMLRVQIANKLHEGRARARRAAIFSCQSKNHPQALLQRVLMCCIHLALVLLCRALV